MHKGNELHTLSWNWMSEDCNPVHLHWQSSSVSDMEGQRFDSITLLKASRHAPNEAGWKLK
jgi:hypothetical protein